METVAFWILAALCLASASFVVFGRDSVVCAMALAFNLVTIAGFYFLLNAQFIAFLQVIVYAGAIMVLIVFVLMLLNVQDEERMRGPRFFQRWLGLVLGVGLFLILFGATWAMRGERFPSTSAGFGTVKSIGTELFSRFYYPFEAISILLVVAMIGAVLLAKRRL